MFTINHVRDGIETLYTASAVQYTGPHAHIGPGGLSLQSDDEGRLPRLLQGGEAFVMNESGATVARYKLPDAPRLTGVMGSAA